jgi:hypothetical protein
MPKRCCKFPEETKVRVELYSNHQFRPSAWMDPV